MCIRFRCCLKRGIEAVVVGSKICYHSAMSKVEKVSISLTPEMTASLKEIVATGAYASTSEIMRDALRDWQEKQLRKREQLAKLRKMLQDSLDSGPSIPFVPGETQRRGRERLAAMLKKSA